MNRSKNRIVLWLVCAWVALSTPAFADEATEAQLQYELGTELYQQGRYAEAIQRFVASHRLVPNANVVLNIVQTFEFLKRGEDAYNWNETYLELATDGSGKQKALAKRAELEKSVAVVEVTTNPKGADLFVDRVDLGSVGRSPRRLAVKPGDHEIIARLARHQEAKHSVSAEVGKSSPLSLTLLPVVGTLKVESTPAGASVRGRDGRELGKTPLSLTLPVGDVSVVVSLPGFVTQTLNARVTEQRAATLRATLEQKASAVAVLSVRGNVPASVLIDGHVVGQSPLSVGQLPPGQRRLEVRANGRQSWSDAILLEPGAATRVEYDLVDPDDRLWPGYRFIGYGVGGVLLASGGIVGLSARGAKSDFEQEPSREKLDRVESLNLTADILMAAGVVVLGATLTWDLLRSPDPSSRGKVVIQR
jgi:hypothetical protein